MKLKGKTAVVTGGASGLGQGIYRRLANEGADVVIGDIQKDLAETVAGQIRENGVQCMAVGTNVKKEADCNVLNQPRHGGATISGWAF